MSFWFILIFIITLFVYIHVCTFLHTNQEFKMYNIQFKSKEQMDDLRKDKIPFKIDNLNTPYFSNAFQFFSLSFNFESLQDSEKKISLYSYDDFIKLNEDDTKMIPSVKFDIDKYLTMQSNNDPSFGFFSHHNYDFVDKYFTKSLESLSIYLKPEFVTLTKYDMLLGMKNMQTGLRYPLSNHFYILVKNGKCRVRLYSPDIVSNIYRKYTNQTEVNVWEKDKNQKQDIHTYKHIDIDLNQGDILYVPTYWSYSILYELPGIIFTIEYDNIMSHLTSIPYKVIEYISYLNIHTKKIKDENIIIP